MKDEDPVKRGTVEKNTKWKINLKDALNRRGVENAFQLWLKFGGSQETAANLYNNNVSMIRLETFDRLEEAFGITPYEILVKIEDNKN